VQHPFWGDVSFFSRCEAAFLKTQTKPDPSHPMVKPSLRTKSIGTKVTDEEYVELERAAQTGGKTLGEWCREVMLKC
jgi:hypothetical protein